jgi:FdhD protein
MHAERIRVVRWESPGRRRRQDDALAVEEPLELRLDGQTLTVTMRTPGHDEELAAGFLLAEGWIARASDLLGIRHSPRNRDKNLLDVALTDIARPMGTARARTTLTASSCGLCGTASIQALRRRFAPIRDSLKLRPEMLLQLPDTMRRQQASFEKTGGLHAAALFDSDGTLQVLREDIGRHNAVDKVIGWALMRDDLPLSKSLLLVSGRTSFEILQKALAAGIPCVASVSAPSSLAVSFARKNRQTLIGFLREGRFNVYTGVRRLGPSAAARP